MRGLPKELTGELLSLVLEEEVSQVMGISGIALRFSYKYLGYAEVNIDTLTRLMKEWMDKQGYTNFSGRERGVQRLYCCEVETSLSNWLYFHSEHTEFEAVLKATQWVAKTKGLI